MTHWKLLSALLFSSVLLTACNSDSDSDDNEAVVTPEEELAERLAAFPATGAALPFSVLRDDLIDGKTMVPFEVRNGGYGSAMTAHPSKPGEFYAMTDRGPNADFAGGAYGSGKTFPVADYTPRIGHFRLTDEGGVEQLGTIMFKRPDGTLITGLPNTSALGGTGETPYNPDGSPVLVDPTQPYDAVTNPIKLDDYGLDGEGLVALRDGSFWMSDEYGPHMVHFAADGKEIDRINPFAADARTRINLPAEFAYRRANRGMEGLAITPDETTLVGLMQSTMDLPSKAVRALTITRIVTVDLETGEIGQYLYQQEKPANSNSEMVGLSNTEFLVLERDGSFLYGGPDGVAGVTPDAQKQVYRIDLSTGTNLETAELQAGMAQDPDLGLTVNGKTLEEVVLDGGWPALAAVGIYPVEKTLALDMVVSADYPHDKMEGLWRIDDQHLGVLNDDDFATWATGNALEQKMLNAGTLDAGTLFIREVDLSVD
ncbi:esterase-like activity of phytase family protein [Halopseudomonas sabulinigri]|uniref:Esterase-like activity of phytase family protein n=1 Tax=Halopseudomonas sabulinigri TaxID=472181 RepID=A0ABP9ZPJ0_9GAMM